MESITKTLEDIQLQLSEMKKMIITTQSEIEKLNESRQKYEKIISANFCPVCKQTCTEGFFCVGCYANHVHESCGMRHHIYDTFRCIDCIAKPKSP